MKEQIKPELVTIEELELHSSDLQKAGLQTEARSLALKLKNQGLMAPELCAIAHYILQDYSNTARKQIQMFDVDLPNTVKKAEGLLENLLKSLGGEQS